MTTDRTKAFSERDGAWGRPTRAALRGGGLGLEEHAKVDLAEVLSGSLELFD